MGYLIRLEGQQKIESGWEWVSLAEIKIEHMTGKSDIIINTLKYPVRTHALLIILSFFEIAI